MEWEEGGGAGAEARGVNMTVAGVRGTTDTRAASAVTVQTLSAADPPVLIDEKTDVESAAITPGALGGTLTYVPSTATPGVVSTHTLKFSTAGQVPSGGQITLQFPASEGWSMSEPPTVAFSPAIGSVTVASGAWAAGTRTLTVTTGGAATPEPRDGSRRS